VYDLSLDPVSLHGPKYGTRNEAEGNLPQAVHCS